jgi:hypothetical protein
MQEVKLSAGVTDTGHATVTDYRLMRVLQFLPPRVLFSQTETHDQLTFVSGCYALFENVLHYVQYAETFQITIFMTSQLGNTTVHR